MNRLEFFDANCRLGPDDLTAAAAPVDAEDIVRAMNAAGIRKALVYSSLPTLYCPAAGNRRILEDIKGHDDLYPCWVLLPESTRELPEGTVSLMLGSGAKAARLFPSSHRFSLAPWCCGALLSELAHRRIPVFIDYEVSHWGDRAIDYSEMEQVCSAYPMLPVVLCGVGVADDRFLYPLFDRLPNLHIELSYYQVEGGIEDICHRYGARRLLFGTGLPGRSPGCAVTYVTYARVSDEEKRAIAGGNLCALLEGVRE